jgi:hypothetical protein
MHGAAEIGCGASAELAADDCLLGFGMPGLRGLGFDVLGFGFVRLCHGVNLKKEGLKNALSKRVGAGYRSSNTGLRWPVMLV